MACFLSDSRKWIPLKYHICYSLVIPAVQIVINGGSRIIETVANTLRVEQNENVTMPVLVVAGSGRAADLLALACKLTNDDNNFNQLAGSYEYVLMNKIEALYPGQSHQENLRTLSFLMKCMKKKRHVSWTSNFFSFLLIPNMVSYSPVGLLFRLMR